MCVSCNKTHGYTRGTLYKDMWMKWEDDGDVHILCPNTADCVFPGVVIKVEPINPHRMEVPFGKYKGDRLDTLKDDKWYLDFLYNLSVKGENKNALMAACIDVMLNRYNPEEYL